MRCAARRRDSSIPHGPAPPLALAARGMDMGMSFETGRLGRQQDYGHGFALAGLEAVKLLRLEGMTLSRTKPHGVAAVVRAVVVPVGRSRALGSGVPVAAAEHPIPITDWFHS